MVIMSLWVFYHLVVLWVWKKNKTFSTTANLFSELLENQSIAICDQPINNLFLFIRDYAVYFNNLKRVLI